MVSTESPVVGVERVGKYEILGKLASGGMGSVFLGRDRSAAGDNWVAIKRIHPHLVARLDVVQMFLNEARILSRLDHHNISGIIDCGTENGAPYIVMSYLHGAALSTVIRSMIDEKQPLPVDLMAYVIASVCDGLHYAHDAHGANGEPLGLVHRDISPQNIFITFGGHVTLLDFGVAKAAVFAGFTRTGHIKGKYGYMSPEQVEAGPLDRRSDIFALGVVLWESLAGRHLFRRKRHIDTLRAIAAADVPALQTVNPNVPPELDAIVGRALIAERRLRYQTAKAMGSDLWSYLRRQRVVIGPHEVATVMQSLFPEQKHPADAHPSITLTEAPALVRSTNDQAVAREPEAAPAEARAAVDGEDDEDPLWEELEPARTALDPHDFVEADAEGGKTEVIAAHPPETEDPTQQVELAFRARIEPFDSGKATIPDRFLEPRARLLIEREVSETLIDSRPPPLVLPDLPQAELPLVLPEVVDREPDSDPDATSPFEALRISRLDAIKEPVRAGNSRAPSAVSPPNTEPREESTRGLKLGMVVLIAVACSVAAAAYTLVTGYVRSQSSSAPKTAAMRARDFATLGLEALDRGETDRAERSLLECVRLAPLPECHRALGSLYTTIKDLQRSRTHYRRYLELLPNAADAPDVQKILAERSSD